MSAEQRVEGIIGCLLVLIAPLWGAWHAFDWAWRWMMNLDPRPDDYQRITIAVLVAMVAGVACSEVAHYLYNRFGKGHD